MLVPKPQLAAGNTGNACTTLAGFINQVTALFGKKIPAATGAQLIADAQRIRAMLAC